MVGLGSEEQIAFKLSESSRFKRREWHFLVCIVVGELWVYVGIYTQPFYIESLQLLSKLQTHPGQAILKLCLLYSLIHQVFILSGLSALGL